MTKADLKKAILMLVCFIAIAALAGCSNKNAAQNNSASENTSVVEEADAAPDVDLTTLSSTMVYSEVYNMMSDPDQYIGKTVKMQGAYAIYHDDSTGKDYHACIIQDATACCSQGLEFSLTDDYAYPDDYPTEGGTITVTGIFDTYQEGEYRYCVLRDARLEA